MTSSRSWSEAVLHSAMIYRSRCKPGDLLQHQWITAQAPTLRTHISTATATRANSIDATGHHLSRLNALAIGAIRLLQRYLNKLSTTTNNNNSLFTAFPASKSTGQVTGVKCLK